MSLRIKTLVFSIVVVLILMDPFDAFAFAQESSVANRHNYYWFNGGAGIGSLGPAFEVSLSYQTGQLLLSPRFAVTSGLFAIGAENINDLGLMAGYSSKRPGSRHYFSAAAGISYVSGTDVSTIGIPIDIQFSLTPFSSAGLGLKGFADINPQRPFLGAILCLQFGKLR